MKTLNLTGYGRPSRRIVTAALLGFFGAAWSQAAVLELSFSGTYDTGGATLFGLSGSAVPYNYEITYDTSLNTSPWFFPAGSSLGGDITTQEWHGYSASGILGCSLTFGTKTWAPADILPRVPAVGVSADLWCDTDLDLAAPTRIWTSFLDTSGNGLEIGSAASVSGSTSLDLVSSVFALHPIRVIATSSDLSIQVVPEIGRAHV